MDASVETAKTDKLGRRSAPRRKYTVAEKRAIVEETQRRGASVAVVAQRHGVNRALDCQFLDEVSQSPWRVPGRPNLRGAGVLLVPGQESGLMANARVPKDI
jgi:hypothetical protein